MRTRFLDLALLGLLGAREAGAQDIVDTRATELAKLRREVETLSSELTLRKDDMRGRLKALEAQNLEIEVQIRREELRLAQLAGEAMSRRSELEAYTAQSTDLVAPLLASIASLRAVVVSGLPYKVTERLADLDQLRDHVSASITTPELGVARLWAFAEDELRLSRENGLDRQVVPLEGREVLADVARLGMAALYFRTDGGEVGVALRDASGWSWSVLADRGEQLEVEALFAKMKHGVRTGSFTLPNPEALP